jgi:hypothetical protein
LLFGEIAQNITLVFLLVCPSHEFVSCAAREDLGVMARRYGIKAETPSPLKQQVKLDVPIALDAWIRRRSFNVGAHEWLDHVVVELLGVVKDVVIDAENLGDASCVVNVGDRTAARIRDAAPELQRGTNDVVTLFE